jgi:hypothetical protein
MCANQVKSVRRANAIRLAPLVHLRFAAAVVSIPKPTINTAELATISALVANNAFLENVNVHKA